MTLEDIQITWKEEFGLWWPSNENDNVFKTMLMRVTDVDVLVKHCRTTGVCVQAGGFIGMWPARLSKFFERVYTFEPMPHLYECVKKNTNHLPSVRVYNNLLSDHIGKVMVAPKRGGCTRVNPGADFETSAISIDSLSLIRCDAIYLDVEHYERTVLDGAKQTVKNFRPAIMLEIKSETEADYDDYMEKTFDYAPVQKVHGDKIYLPK